MSEIRDNEAAYDQLIWPLVDQIMAICKEHQIPFIFQAQLKAGDETNDDTSMFATAFLLPEGTHDNLRTHAVALRNGPPSPFVAMTLTRSPDGASDDD